MHRALKFHLLFPLLILGLSAAALGQGGAVTVKLLSFPRIAEPEKVELIIGEKKTIEVEIPSNRFSDPYKVPKCASWTLGKTDPAAENGFKVYGTGRSLGAPHQLLLLLRKGPNNEDGFRVIPFNTTKAGFGGRQFLIINMARQDVAGQVGKQRFIIKPGKHTVISPKADQGKDLCHAMLMIPKEEEWKTFFSSNWPLRDDARGFIMIYNIPGSTRVKLHSIRDFL